MMSLTPEGNVVTPPSHVGMHANAHCGFGYIYIYYLIDFTRNARFEMTNAFDGTEVQDELLIRILVASHWLYEIFMEKCS